MITAKIKHDIDKLWDAFWTAGTSNPLTIIEQITYLLFIRLADLEEARDENKSGMNFNRRFSDEEQGLRWSNFSQLSNEEMMPIVRDKVFPHFQKSNLSTIVGYMKDAQLLIQTDKHLGNIVSLIDKLPFTEENIRAEIYEYILSKMTMGGTHGQFRTPRHITRLIVEMMEPKPTDLIADPSVGTGGFLVQTIEYLKEKFASPEAVIENTDPDTGKVTKIFTGDLLEKHSTHIRSTMFYGYDFDLTMLRIAAMNMMLHGIDNPEVHGLDTLSHVFRERFHKAATDGFNLILANPPFAGSVDFEAVDADLLRKVKTKKTELLFIVLISRMLLPGGRSATIVADGVLFGTSNAHIAVRKQLIENNKVEAVISLPVGVFKPYAGVSTSILIFSKGGETKNVFFYDVEADGFSLDDRRETVDENDLPECLARWQARDTEKNTDRKAKSFFVSAGEIRDSNYDLSLNRYKERVYEEEETYDPPKVILQSMKLLNEEIASELMVLEEMLK